MHPSIGVPSRMTSARPNPSSSTPEYVLGANAAELERLGLQHALWTDAAHALWKRAGIQPGWNVLDLGCGPGFCTLDLARLVGALSGDGPRGEVVGMDESAMYLDHLRAQAAARGMGNVRTVVSDALLLAKAKGIDADFFDAAYARWLMCFVRDPASVVRGVHRALKPGGRFVVQDYFNYEAMTSAPRGPAFTKTLRATAEAWRARGGDPDIMGRLPAMLEGMGFTIEHLAVNQRLARPGEPMWHWPQSFWQNFLPVLVELGLLTEADRAAWWAEWEELARTPGAYVYLPPLFDLIAVRRK